MTLIHLILICLSLSAFGSSLSYNRHANDVDVILVANATQSLKTSNGNPSVVIFDYGRSVEGIPTFDVVSATGDTSRLEVTYAESKAALSKYMV